MFGAVATGLLGYAAGAVWCLAATGAMYIAHGGASRRLLERDWMAGRAVSALAVCVTIIALALLARKRTPRWPVLASVFLILVASSEWLMRDVLWR